MEYANGHPSDRVGELAQEVERAVWRDLVSTAALLGSRKTGETMDSYSASQRAHDEADATVERLMAEIRRY